MNNLIKKGVAVAIIVLFIGLAFAPSINANVSKVSVDSELVEFTTEVCGISGIKPNTVRLTIEKAEELERLFDSIGEQLDEVNTKEDAVEILNNVLVDFEKYELFGRLPIQRIQWFLTNGIYTSKIATFLRNIYNRVNSNTNEYEANSTLIIGKTSNTGFFGPLYKFLPSIPHILYYLFHRIIPISLFEVITFGYKIWVWEHGDGYHPSGGWIYTFNSNNSQKLTGPFYGQYAKIHFSVGVMQSWECIGATGFIGIKISRISLPDSIIERTSNSFFIGYALKVSLSEEYPFD